MEMEFVQREQTSSEIGLFFFFVFVSLAGENELSQCFSRANLDLTQFLLSFLANSKHFLSIYTQFSHTNAGRCHFTDAIYFHLDFVFCIVFSLLSFSVHTHYCHCCPNIVSARKLALNQKWFLWCVICTYFVLFNYFHYCLI